MLDPRRNHPTISFPSTQSYDTWDATNSVFGASNRGPKNYRNCHSWNDAEQVQLGTEAKVDDESGICSPPLWTPRSPHQRRNYYRTLSPKSKTQAIERGQRELMEMVQNMPESNYELSLKDLVEHPRVDVGEEKNLSNKNMHIIKGPVKKGVSGKIIDSGGFYLKMGFPTSFGSKKKKKKDESSSVNNNSLRVSPRPSTSDGSAKGLDKEWWKKSLSVFAGESDSGVSSINSGSIKSTGSSSSSSSSRSSSRYEMSGVSSCWPFIRRPERPSQK